MNFHTLPKFVAWRHSLMIAAVFAVGAVAAFGQHERGTLIVTSTNNASGNAVEVFKLDAGEKPSLSLVQTLPTGGLGGASGNAGSVQFREEYGAVTNYGSNTVSQLVRRGDGLGIGETIHLTPDCVRPDSVALAGEHLFVVGANCAESHAWPAGYADGAAVSLSDASAAQIAVGRSWAAVTFTSGTVLQLPLTHEDGALNGTSTPLTLPDEANNTPLGAAFWGNTLGFTPAHSPDSFAVVDESGTVNPIVGPSPAYPVNAPCWVAKGPGNVWYTGNAPGLAISIFFTDDQGGVFYKSVPLPGSPTDITVSADKKWLAVIYTAGGNGYVGVFSIDAHGDLTQVATSKAVGVASFNGVAISE